MTTVPPTRTFRTDATILRQAVGVSFVLWVALALVMVVLPLFGYSVHDEPGPNWSGLSIMTLLGIAGLLLMWRQHHVTARIAFTGKGIEKPGLIRNRFLAWKDVEEVERLDGLYGPTVLQLRSSPHHMRIFMLAFADPSEVEQFIRAEVATHSGVDRA